MHRVGARSVSADHLSGSVRAVLFDLDGTMLDTAADITVALNRAVGSHLSWPKMPVSRYLQRLPRGSCPLKSLQSSWRSNRRG